MTKTDKEVIGVIGAGTMGSGIAHVAATAGHSVLLFDSYPGAVEKASAERGKLLSRLVEKGKLTNEEAGRISTSILSPSTLKDLAACDVVIEAIVEDASVKQKT